MANPFQLIGETIRRTAKQAARVPQYAGRTQTLNPDERRARGRGGGQGTPGNVPQYRGVPINPAPGRRERDLNVGLRGAGAVPAGQRFVPGYRAPYDVQQGIVQGVRGMLNRWIPGRAPNPLRREDFGVSAPGTYYSGIGANQVPYDVTEIPNVQAWQRALDYQDAAERARQRGMITNLAGIGGAIGRAGRGIAERIASYNDPYARIENIRLNRGAPAVSDWMPMEQQQYVPEYQGYGGGGGYGGWGGGGGGGGGPREMPPWFYGLTNWRI